MTHIQLHIKNPSRYSFDRERLFDVAMRTIRSQKLEAGSQKLEVSLLIVNKTQMAKYNWQYHQTKGPTDVLSFPYTDPESQVTLDEFALPPDWGLVLGDIIVCHPIARETGIKEGKSTQDMIEFYVEHGLMHLLGHHHE